MPEKRSVLPAEEQQKSFISLGGWGREVEKKGGGLVSSLDPLDLLFGSVIGAAERKEGTRQVEFGNPFSPRQYLQVFCLNEVDGFPDGN